MSMKASAGRVRSKRFGRALLGLAVLTVLGGGLLLGARWPGDPAQPAEPRDEIPSRSAPNAVDLDAGSEPVGARVQHPPAASSAGPALWEGGYAPARTDFKAGQALLAARYGAGSPQLASYTVDWSYACGSHLGNRVAAASEGLTRAGAILGDFCGGLRRTSDADEGALYRQGVRTRFALELTGIEQAHGVDAALDFAEQFIREAQDPYSVRAGLDYLAGIDVLYPPAAERGASSGRRLHEIYQMARDSYLCDAYGGCSATSPASARFCLETKCSNLMDYRSQVGSQLSRADRPAFDWYLSAIRTLRK